MDREKLAKIIPAIAQQNHFRLETIEKDYYLTLILNHVESHLSERLVFKGGTLLNKIHLNYHRLSEDIDFTYLMPEGLESRSKRSRAIAPIREKMPELLRLLDLKSDQPEGSGFNNSTQYEFNISYPSIITGHNGNIKLEISLRQAPLDKPVHNAITHFYQDPFTGEDLIPRNRILSLSLNEAVAEKLKCAVARRDAAIRDFYDLWYIAESKFDFKNKQLQSLFKKKLKGEQYKGDFSRNFGLDEKTLALLYRQIEPDLMPVLRIGEDFNLDKVLKRFNGILKGF